MQEPPLPASKDAEAAVIASVLIDPMVGSALRWMTSRMFVSPRHRFIWQAIESCFELGKPTDLLSVEDEMDRIKYGSSDEYHQEIMSMINGLPTTANSENYAAIVREKYQLRAFIHLSTQIAGSAYGQGKPEQIGMEMMQKIARIMEITPNTNNGRQTLPQVLDRLHEETERRMQNEYTVVKSGYPGIDKHIGGFEPGELIYVAARPGAGKSAWGTSIAQRLAARFHRYNLGAVDFFSMEMSILAQARRMVASVTNPVIETKTMRAGFRMESEIDVQAYARFLTHVAERSETIGDALAFHEGAMTTDMLGMRLLECKANYGTRVAIIDQLDHFLDRSKNDDPTARIADISRKLKHMATRLQITIICLAQLNRKTEDRADKRPQMSDLKQSGNLEQDADMIFSLYRPSYYYNKPDDPECYTQWAELEILKNRDADVGIVPLCFRGQQVYFDDWDDQRFPIDRMNALVEEKEQGK